MNYCTNCGHGLENHENFCSECGAINLKEGSNAFDRFIKEFKYLFVNPVSFVRSGSRFNLVNSGIMLGLIAILQFIILKVIGKDLSLDKGFIIIFPLSAILLCLHSILISTFSGIINKKKISFNNVLSISLYAELVFYFCLFIGMILGSIISVKIFFIMLIFSRLFSLMLLYQTLKSIVQAENSFDVIKTLILSSILTLFILILVLKAFIKNSL